MRFVNWLVQVLGALGRGADAASSAGPGVLSDEATRRAEADAAFRARRDYRP